MIWGTNFFPALVLTVDRITQKSFLSWRSLCSLPLQPPLFVFNGLILQFWHSVFSPICFFLLYFQIFPCLSFLFDLSCCYLGIIRDFYQRLFMIFWSGRKVFLWHFCPVPYIMKLSLVHVLVTSLPSDKTLFLITVNNNDSWNPIKLCRFKDISSASHKVKRNEM